MSLFYEDHSLKSWSQLNNFSRRSRCAAGQQKHNSQIHEKVPTQIFQCVSPHIPQTTFLVLKSLESMCCIVFIIIKILVTVIIMIIMIIIIVVSLFFKCLPLLAKVVQWKCNNCCSNIQAIVHNSILVKK